MGTITEKKTLWMSRQSEGKYQPKLGSENYGDVQPTEKSCAELLKEAESFGISVVAPSITRSN